MHEANTAAHKKILLVLADLPFRPQESPPRTPAVVIADWQTEAGTLPAAPKGLSDWDLVELMGLPPLAILSLDPTDRLEAAFREESLPLRVVLTRDDLPANRQTTLLKLGGDLVTRTGLFLSWKDVREARSNPDKKYLLDEAARLTGDAIVVVFAPAPDEDFRQIWLLLLSTVLKGAGALWAVGPEDFDWPKSIDYQGTDLLEILGDIELAPEPEPEPESTTVPEGYLSPFPRIEIHTGGGAYIGGDVYTGGGDLIGGSKYLFPTRGEQDTEGGVLIPKSPLETVIGPITAEMAVPEMKTLRIDTAAPDRVYVGKEFELAVAIRQLSSPVLEEADLPRVDSGEMQVTWPTGMPSVKLRVEVSAPACEVHGSNSRIFRLYAGQDSPVFYFQMTPRETGRVSIVVTVYQEEEWLGNARLYTEAYEKVTGKVEMVFTSHELTAKSYQPVDIRIFKASGEEKAYPIELHIPNGPDFEGGTLRLPLERLRALEVNSEGYGKALGEAFFAKEALEDAYQETQAFFQGKTCRPRVRLRIDPAELAPIRWERLYHPVSGEWQPLSATVDTLLSRYVPARSWEQPLPLEVRPLRLLLVLASPKDLADYNLDPISKEERDMWRTLFAGQPDLHVDCLESETAAPPTLEQLKQALMEGYHMVHFVCHGASTSKGTTLFLEKEDGTTARVTTAKLVEAFRALPQQPHFCFLATCESATYEESGAFLPLGPALVAKGGVPAVVAMAERVKRETATEFADTFYERLLTHGTVDLAVHEARQQVREHWDWSVPVLFSRLPDNQLLAIPPAPLQPKSPLRGVEQP